MRTLLRYFFIALFTISFWVVVFAGMLKGGRCISTAECAICVACGVIGFLVSGFGITKIERK